MPAPALHHHRPLWPSHCPSPDLPPPSPPPASESEVIVSDEPLPPPPPELRTTPAPTPVPTSKSSSSPSPPPSQVPKTLSLPSPPAASPRVSPVASDTSPTASVAAPASTPGHDRLNSSHPWRQHKSTYLETSFEASPTPTPTPASNVHQLPARAVPSPGRPAVRQTVLQTVRQTAHQQLQLPERAAPERQSLCVRKPRAATLARSESVKEAASEAVKPVPRYSAGNVSALREQRQRLRQRDRQPEERLAAAKLAVNGEVGFACRATLRPQPRR